MWQVANVMADDPGTKDNGIRSSLVAMITDDPGRLRRRSISLGVSPDDADDVAQTVLLRAWRSIEHLHTPEPGQMCSWLDTIARNAATDLARQQSRRPAVDLDEDLSDTRTVSQEVEMRVILDGALRAIHSLPETLRDPLLMSVADDLSAPEIAERLQITPATARQRIARARKALASCRASGMSESS
jgi:RNA polymerase sigma factor (sigma-70 family)